MKTLTLFWANPGITDELHPLELWRELRQVCGEVQAVHHLCVARLVEEVSGDGKRLSRKLGDLSLAA